MGRDQADRLVDLGQPQQRHGAGRGDHPIYGSAQWDKLNQKERDELGHHLSAWLFSQFLHGEQGALTVAGRIVESVPDMDSKFYAATQAMDEARHVELYAKFMREKIGLYYPVNPDLAKLLADALSDSRWDMPYLGMQVLIEGLALAAFGVHRDLSNNALVTQLLAYVMQDEARHVAFGRLALRDYYKELTDAERADREEFIVEGCYLMRNRFTGREVWERMGFDVQECLEFTEQSPIQQAFRTLLFSRIVPCVTGHRPVGPEGPARLHRPGRHRGRRLRPRGPDARRRGTGGEDRRGEVRGRARHPAGRGAGGDLTGRRPRLAVSRVKRWPGHASRPRGAGLMVFFGRRCRRRAAMAWAPTLIMRPRVRGLGQLASFGLPEWRRAGRQARNGVTRVRARHSGFGVWSGPSSL